MTPRGALRAVSEVSTQICTLFWGGVWTFENKVWDEFCGGTHSNIFFFSFFRNAAKTSNSRFGAEYDCLNSFLQREKWLIFIIFIENTSKWPLEFSNQNIETKWAWRKVRDAENLEFLKVRILSDENCLQNNFNAKLHEFSDLHRSSEASERLRILWNVEKECLSTFSSDHWGRRFAVLFCAVETLPNLAMANWTTKLVIVVHWILHSQNEKKINGIPLQGCFFVPNCPGVSRFVPVCPRLSQLIAEKAINRDKWGQTGIKEDISGHFWKRPHGSTPT